MNSPNPLNPGEKLYNQFDIKESFGNKKGTYRFRVDAMTIRATMLKRLVCSTLANFIAPSFMADETVIARFAQKPSARTAFLGATVGSYGSARFILEKDGSLRFDGMSANDNTFVCRFEINESIPLW